MGHMLKQTDQLSISQHNLYQSAILVSNKDVTKAEILIVVKSVVSLILQISMYNFCKICRKLFLDRDIAVNIKNRRAKMQHIINHVMGSYHEVKLYVELNHTNAVPPKFTTCFQESFIKVSHNKQFVNIIYFDKESKRVCTKYLSS